MAEVVTEELSVIGRLLDAADRVVVVQKPERMFAQNGTGDVDVILRLKSLLDKKALGMNVLDYLYVTIMKSIKDIMRKYPECAESVLRPEGKDFIQALMPMVISETIRILRSRPKNKVNKLNLAKAEKALTFWQSNTDLARIILEAAFHDAPIRFLREEIRVRADSTIH